METISCLSCNKINGASQETCIDCGDSLAAAKLQHNIDEVRKATEKLHELRQPSPSFSSFNGFGTTLFDYRLRQDGKYDVTRWVVAMGLPIFPLSSYVIKPVAQNFGYGRATSNFRIVEKVPISLARIFRTYLLAIVGVAPIITGFFYSTWLNHTLGGPLAFLAMLVAIGWAIYFIFFRLKNDSKAYKANTASEG